METLRSHCSLADFLPTVCRRSSPPSLSARPLARSWIRSLKDPKLIGSGFGRISIYGTPPLRSVPPISSPLPELVEEVITGNGAPKVQIESETRTAHVKFVLQRPCLFGERFFLVGDDPMFGLWDAENAIPLDWSEGHFWTAEMDLPFGKSVQFKFILRGASGEFHWQPGPDRVLQVWETANTIVVTEDWENAESQKITEEQYIDLVNKAVASENTVAGNLAELDCFKQPGEVTSSGNMGINSCAESIHTQLHADINNGGSGALVPGLTAQAGDVLFTSEEDENQFSGDQGEGPNVSNGKPLAEATVDDSGETLIGVPSNGVHPVRKALHHLLSKLGIRQNLAVAEAK